MIEMTPEQAERAERYRAMKRQQAADRRVGMLSKYGLHYARVVPTRLQDAVGHVVAYNTNTGELTIEPFDGGPRRKVHARDTYDIPVTAFQIGDHIGWLP